MLRITREFVINTGQNPAAVKNGSDLVRNGNFTSLSIDKDETIIFGMCRGSGASAYSCSADFQDGEAPVFRCSCPSRQIPCKHCLGLMLAYVESRTFKTENIPDDIVQKRANKEKRKEKKERAQAEDVKSAKAPKNDSWKKAAIKKNEAQLNGLDECKKLLELIVETGIGSVNAKAMSGYLSVTKQLDSYYISGVQNEFFSLLDLIKNGTEDDYADITAKICRLHALINKSEAYLCEKKNAPDMVDITSEIEELIGYPWKLEELKRYGLIEENARLVQLAFHVVNETDKKQFVDIGYCISLNSGKVYLTKNYRPYKAVKHIKEDNSINSVMNINELFIYPGVSLNQRVRWSTVEFSELTPDICFRINELGSGNFIDVIKAVKNQFKNLMLDSFPTVLVNFTKIYKTTGETDSFIIEDKDGNRILLSENKYFDENFIDLLNDASITESSEKSVLAAFYNDLSKGVLAAHPLALVTGGKIVKMLY